MCEHLLEHAFYIFADLGEGGDDGGDGGRITWPPPAPLPSHPGIQHPIRATPRSDFGILETYVGIMGTCTFFKRVQQTSEFGNRLKQPEAA